MRRWVLIAGLIGLAACSSGAREPRPGPALSEVISVSSPAFGNAAAIPPRFTCAGDDVSPPLRWTGVPQGAASVAVVVDDPDAPRGTYVHWIVVGLPRAFTGRLREGTLPAGARQLPNSAGKAAWSGPCPPPGPAHHYRFTVYALIREPRLTRDADPAAAVEAIEASATARGRMEATFAR